MYIAAKKESRVPELGSVSCGKHVPKKKKIKIKTKQTTNNKNKQTKKQQERMAFQYGFKTAF